MDSQLLSRLEHSPYRTGILSEFTSYLKPFSEFITTKTKNKKKNPKITTKASDRDSLQLRSLAKQFLPFISRLLKICQSSSSKRIPEASEDGIAEFFEIYKLALDCLYCIWPCLAGKPYSVHLQRFAMVRRLEIWERYEEAEEQCFFIRECLGSEMVGNKKGNSVSDECLLVPNSMGNADPDLAGLVVEIVVVAVNCAYRSKSEDSGRYRRILVMFEQVQPWLRVLDSGTCEKLHGMLFSALYKCTLFLLGESTRSDGDLLRSFCVLLFHECLKSAVQEQFAKIAHRLCSSLAAQCAGKSSLVLDIIRSALESISCKCKVLPPIMSIASFYAAGLLLMNIDVSGGHKSFISKGTGCLSNTTMLRMIDALSSLTALIRANKDVCIVPSTTSKFKPEGSIACVHFHGDASVSSCLNALEFFCEPFAEFINAEWQNMSSKNVDVPFSDNINFVLDAFYLFCDGFHIEFSKASAEEMERRHKSRRALLSVAIATLRIALITQSGTQKCMDCIGYIISREWIQSQELKYLITSLYNIGVSMYNTKLYEQASIALKLCHRALWTHIALLCKIVDKSEGTQNDILSQNAIAQSINDACAKSAIFLDAQHRCGNPVMAIIVDSLVNWSNAQSKLKKLTSPMVMVAQWVKTVCSDFKDAGAAENAPTLYSLLSNGSITWPSEIMGIILEQEHLAYAEMGAREPSLCQRMEQKIINALLDIYVGKDYYVQRSRVLVSKSRISRASDGEGLESSIHCLSEAISILKTLFGEASSSSASLCHQLALIYCMHALCTQEADQNSEVILHDINCALELWSRIDISNFCFRDDQNELITQNELPLLFHIVDLLSLKGYLHLQYEIYKLIIILCKCKNIGLEECLTMLWGSRRLNHAMCTSPIDEALILNLSEKFDVRANSIEFWTCFLKECPVLLLEFRQMVLLSNSLEGQVARCCYNKSFCSHISVVDIDKAASELISNVPVASRSMFIAGYLYYDLCQRLISNGRLLQALSYSRKALQLRMKLLQRNFTFNVQKLSMEDTENSENNLQNKYGHIQLEALSSVTTKVWPDIAKSEKLEGFIMSPWNALRCYLESAMQVGIIYESIGNCDEAESICLMGKKISCLQGLSFFKAVFGSLLGKIYRKRQQWELAENELEGAQKFFAESSTTISCKWCKLSMEITLETEIGDLVRSRSYNVVLGRSIQSLNHALDLYKSAIGKLEVFDMENSFSIYEKPIMENTDFCNSITRDADYGMVCSAGECLSNKSLQPNLFKLCSLKVEDEGSHMKTRYKKSKKCKNSKNPVDEDENGSLIQEGFLRVPSSLQTSVAECGSNGRCSCNQKNCWSCLMKKVLETGFLQNIISLKRKCHYKRLLVRLLIQIGKCMSVLGETHEVHKLFCQIISLLFNGVSPCQTHPDIPLSLLLEFICEGSPGDMFAVEHAVILYHISWFSLRRCLSDHSRTSCCLFSEIQMQRVVICLLRAFVLGREMPRFFQKVSKLLSVIHLLSTSGSPFSLLAYSEAPLSASHWATFFHQASLGTYQHHQHLSILSEKIESGCSTVPKNSHIDGATQLTMEACNSLRFAPEKLDDLEGFVKNFFQSLPSVTSVCISLLGSCFSTLLGEMLNLPSPSFPVWLLLSRLDARRGPIGILLPVDSVLGEAEQDASEAYVSRKKWVCPWSHNLVDEVAPEFRLILEENYSSTTQFPLVDTLENRSTWWTQRTRLNNRLDNFLKNMEDLWLGPWRCLLLGEPKDSTSLETVNKKLVGSLKRRFKFDANESLLLVVLGGRKSCADLEDCVRQLLLHNGYFGISGCSWEERSSFLSTTHVTEGDDLMPHKLILQSICQLEQECEESAGERDPIVLVLDADVQMLPWESLPILRKHEVYRMPSVGSISLTLKRRHQNKAHDGVLVSTFPSLDPLDAYYLLNPSGDLASTQAGFEDWFKTQMWEGKAGTVPTADELALALQKHDLFLYFGHGSGERYLPGHKIAKLERCAAAFLMGCSSGSLFIPGCYAPRGAPLSYLLAGCPAVVANLWDVTDKDINRFSKVLLDDWLQQQSTEPQAVRRCPKCDALAEEFRGMDLGIKGKAKGRKSTRAPRGKGKSEETCICKHRDCDSNGATMLRTMGEARDACKLPFLIGASPICYGVPTFIRKKEE